MSEKHSCDSSCNADALDARREQLREQQVQAEEFILKDYSISESERVEMEALLEIANERAKEAHEVAEPLPMVPPLCLPPIPKLRRGQVQPQGVTPVPFPSPRVAIAHAAMQNEQVLESLPRDEQKLIAHYVEKPITWEEKVQILQSEREQEYRRMSAKIPKLYGRIPILPIDCYRDKPHDGPCNGFATPACGGFISPTERSPDWHGGDNCSFHPLPTNTIGGPESRTGGLSDREIENIKHELEKAAKEAKTSHDQPPPKINTHEPLWPAVISDIGAMLFISPNAPTDSLLDRVMEDMRERDTVGRERYGTPLQPFNGRDPIRDAYAEALDMAVYLKQALVENTNPLSGFDLLFLYHNALGQILALRREIALRDTLKKDSV